MFTCASTSSLFSSLSRSSVLLDIRPFYRRQTDRVKQTGGRFHKGNTAFLLEFAHLLTTVQMAVSKEPDLLSRSSRVITNLLKPVKPRRRCVGDHLSFWRSPSLKCREITRGHAIKYVPIRRSPLFKKTLFDELPNGLYNFRRPLSGVSMGYPPMKDAVHGVLCTWMPS
jgi:hypothetical protein